MKRLIALIVPLALGCTVVTPVVRPVGPGGPPPASSGAITAGEAEAIALKIARERGYSEARAEKVHHDEGQGGRWKVEVLGLANGRDGKLDVRISDGGQVLEVKDHQKDDKGKDDKDKDDKEKGKGKDKEKDKEKKDK